MENEEQNKNKTNKTTNINNSMINNNTSSNNNSSHSMINNNASSNNASSPVHSINSSPVHSINSSPSRQSSYAFFSPQHLTSPVQQQHESQAQPQQSSSFPTNSPDKTTATVKENTNTTKKMSNNNNISSSSLSPNLSPVFIPSKSVRDKPAVMTKVNDSNSEFEFDFATVVNGEERDRDHDRDSDHVVVDGGGGGRNVREAKTKRTVRVMGERLKRKAFLGFRISGMILCLVSFSIMATDKHQGWALDSFDRYKELRYCLAVNVIGFVYSAAQASVVVYDMATGNYKPHNIIRNHFDFFMDQALSYLLISASSSAATRIEDWTSNWGEDKFTQTATVSIALSFLAFGALALSSLLSGFTLFTPRSTS